jgi:hypothetical protein
VKADVTYACGYCLSYYDRPENAVDCAEICKPFWTKDWDGKFGLGGPAGEWKEILIIGRNRRKRVEETEVKYGAKRFHIRNARTFECTDADTVCFRFIRKDLPLEEFCGRLKFAFRALDTIVDELVKEIGMIRQQNREG